jgi:hypothetical protein
VPKGESSRQPISEEGFFDCLFGFLGGERIVAGVRAMNDAGVRVGEWMLGVSIYEKA